MTRRIRTTSVLATLLFLRLAEVAGETIAMLAGSGFDRFSDWTGDRS